MRDVTSHGLGLKTLYFVMVFISSTLSFYSKTHLIIFWTCHEWICDEYNLNALFQRNHHSECLEGANPSQ